MQTRSDPRPLAVARLGLGLSAVMLAVETHLFLARIARGAVSMPAFDWLPAPTILPVNGLLMIGVVSGFALMVGYRSRLAAALTVLCAASVVLWDQQTYSNHRMLIVLLCCYLAASNAGAVWSVDAIRRGKGAASVPHWPQLLMMVQVSVCYLFAALSKINPVFLSGDVLGDHVWWPLPNWVFPPLALATVAVELALAIGLWLPRVRALAALMGLGLHASIVLMLREPVVLVTFALACLAIYPLFLSRPRPVGVVRSVRSTRRTDELTTESVGPTRVRT